jgi:hypothetical protein
MKLPAALASTLVAASLAAAWPGHGFVAPALAQKAGPLDLLGIEPPPPEKPQRRPAPARPRPPADTAVRAPETFPLPRPRPDHAAEDVVTQAPAPEPRPSDPPRAPEAAAKPEPAPTARPEPKPDTTAAEAPGDRAPEAPPEAQPRPRPPAPETAEKPATAEKPPANAPPPPPAPVRLSEDDYKQCLERVTALGVKLTPKPPISDPDGCVIERPLAVTELGGGVKLSAPAVLACPMAEALAWWSASVLVPDAEAILKARPVLVSVGTSYQCRPRNGVTGAKLSEHGIGNAADIGAIKLDDGTTVPIVALPPPSDDETEPAEDDADARMRFLRSIRAGACVNFTTVLGPGSDPSHAEHFHFDLAVRRNGFRICQ